MLIFNFKKLLQVIMPLQLVALIGLAEPIVTFKEQLSSSSSQATNKFPSHLELVPKNNKMSESILNYNTLGGVNFSDYSQEQFLGLLRSTVEESINSRAGAGSSGGGFRYADTSSYYLRKSAEFLFYWLSAVTQEDMNNLIKLYLPHRYKSNEVLVDISLLRKIILNYEEAPLYQRKAINNDGYEAPLDFSINPEKGTILALNPFFTSFDIRLEEIKTSDYLSIKRKLIHEALHLFTVGSQDDREAWIISNKLTDLAYEFKLIELCGHYGDIKNRIIGCKKIPSSTYNLPIISSGYHQLLDVDNKYSYAEYAFYYGYSQKYMRGIKYLMLNGSNNYVLYFKPKYNKFANISEYLKADPAEAEGLCKELGLAINIKGLNWRLPLAKEVVELKDSLFSENGYEDKFLFRSAEGKIKTYDFKSGKIKKTSNKGIFTQYRYRFFCVASK